MAADSHLKSERETARRSQRNGTGSGNSCEQRCGGTERKMKRGESGGRERLAARLYKDVGIAQKAHASTEGST